MRGRQVCLASRLMSNWMNEGPPAEMERGWAQVEKDESSVLTMWMPETSSKCQTGSWV